MAQGVTSAASPHAALPCLGSTQWAPFSASSLQLSFPNSTLPAAGLSVFQIQSLGKARPLNKVTLGLQVLD